jgi:hypothetical protein
MMGAANRNPRRQDPGVLGHLAGTRRCAVCGGAFSATDRTTLRLQPPDDPHGPSQAVHIACWLPWRTAQAARLSA